MIQESIFRKIRFRHLFLQSQRGSPSRLHTLLMLQSILILIEYLWWQIYKWIYKWYKQELNNNIVKLSISKKKSLSVKDMKFNICHYFINFVCVCVERCMPCIHVEEEDNLQIFSSCCPSVIKLDINYVYLLIHLAELLLKMEPVVVK